MVKKSATLLMRKLKKQEIERLCRRFEASASNGARRSDEKWMQALEVNTRIDLPTGEIANPDLKGLVLVWSLTKNFIQGEITDQHQYNAQGLEGLVSINDVPLRMALLAAKKTGLYRIEIFVPRDWQCDSLREGTEEEDLEEEEA